MQLLASGKAIASKSTDINKQIAATKEQIGKAEYERKRTENLLKENAATQKQIDDIDSQIAVLKNSWKHRSPRFNAAMPVSQKKARPTKYK